MSDQWLRRIAWAMAVVVIVLLVVGMIMLLVAPASADLAQTANLVSGLLAIGAPVLGLLILTRQPRNRIGWLWIIYGLIVGLRSFGHGIYYLNGSQHSGYSGLELFFLWVTEPANLTTLVIFILFLLWFPDGRLPSRRWRFLYLWLIPAFFILYASLFVPGTDWNGGGEAGGIVIENPYGWLSSGPLYNTVWSLGFPSFISILLIIILSAISLVFRYRSAGQLVRLQLRWFVFGGIVSVILFMLPVPTGASPGQFTGGLTNILVLVGQAYVVPLYVAVGMAILRYRLYDIDIIIRKTLVYAVLSVLLALVYFGSVVLLQQVFGQVTGVAEGSPLAVVVSTLLIAALFTPLRRRIQNWIDRRFFRRKYDAQRVLAQFALTARDETDLDALTAGVASVVKETMQPERVSVWLRPTKSPKGG